MLKRLLACKSVANLAGAALNRTRIREYGKVLKLEFDPNTCSLRANVLLQGESEPIHVEIGRFEILPANGNGKGRIILRDIKTSRPWITAICARLLENKPIEVDPAICSCLSLIL